MDWREAARVIAVIAAYIFIGRRLNYLPAYHVFCLSKRVRRFLFVVDVKATAISITAIIWQIMFYLTAVFSCTAYFLLGYHRFRLLLYYIVLYEWLGVGNALGIYSAISDIILKRKMNGK
mgnify:FL=1